MKRKGLSLLEILVSTVILALVVAGLASIFISGKRWILHTRSRMTAGELGKYFLDPLQMQVKQDTWDTAANTLTLGTRNESITIDRPYNATYNITNVTGTTLRRVRVNIAWDETTP